MEIESGRNRDKEAIESGRNDDGKEKDYVDVKLTTVRSEQSDNTPQLYEIPSN